MPNRYGTMVGFTLEKNVWKLSAHVTFGANGVPTLDTTNSKGFCNVSQATQTFTATASTTASYTAVSNLKGLYNGMVISGTNVASGSVISALNAAGTFTSSLASTGVVSSVTATGGYTFQLGVQAGVRLDTYVKVLGIQVLNDLSGAQGGASTLALAPVASHWFMTNNSVSQAQIASFTLMCGTGNGTTFVQANPASGEGIFVEVMLGGSTSI